MPNNEQAYARHHVNSDLASHVTRYSLPPVSPAITQGAPPITEAVVAALDAEINRQALMIAYIDDFWLMMLVTLAAAPLLLLLRKGRRPGAGAPAMAD